jgi:hypothetical protein
MLFADAEACAADELLVGDAAEASGASDADAAEFGGRDGAEAEVIASADEMLEICMFPSVSFCLVLRRSAHQL